MGIQSGQPVTPTELERLRVTCEALAERIDQLGSQVGTDQVSVPSMGFSDSKLATIAHSIYKARRNRLREFSKRLFAEPAWDMLLDMFIKTAKGERISTTSLCIAADVPQSTGLRWIAILEEEGLLRRYNAPDDRRLVLIEMTTAAYQAMRRYVTEGVTRFEMPLPE